MRAALATAADGPAPVASGTFEERVAAICGLFPGLYMPSTTDDNLSRPADKRQQRHENITDAEVNLMVKTVVMPIAQRVLVLRGRWWAGTRCVFRFRKKEMNTCGKSGINSRGIAWLAAATRRLHSLLSTGATGKPG